MNNTYLENTENTEDYEDFDDFVNPTLLVAASKAASELATEFDLIDIADIGDGPEYARTLADTFMSYIENNKPHIQEHENYQDFKESLADALIADTTNVLSQALDPANVQEDPEWFAKNATITIESEMDAFGIPYEQ